HRGHPRGRQPDRRAARPHINRKELKMFGFEIGLTGGIALLLLLLVGLMFILYLVPIPLWIAAWASGAYVGLFTLIGMRLRRVPARYRHHGAHQLGQSRIGYPAERPG